MNITVNDLIISAQEIYRKYNIPDFEKEVSDIFSSIGLDYKKIDLMIQNEEEFINSDFINNDISDASLYECIKKYTEVRKKYNYDKYVKDGYKIRKAFLDERKEYTFIKNSNIPSNCTELYKLNLDYNEQHSSSIWLDRSLKKAYPDSFTIKYEDVDGKIKKIVAQHKSIDIDQEYIEAPLIDRVIGTTVFDSFLLHSFYDTLTKKWKYVPIKLIVSIESNKSPEDVNFDNIFEDEE